MELSDEERKKIVKGYSAGGDSEDPEEDDDMGEVHLAAQAFSDAVHSKDATKIASAWKRMSDCAGDIKGEDDEED